MRNYTDIASDLLLADFSVLPVNDNKRPALPTWTELQRRPMAAEYADEVFKNCAGIAVICGSVSHNLECIDFDSHNKDIADIYNRWASPADVANILSKCYIETSKNGGIHVLYRYEAKQPEGNQKLSMWASGEAMIETRGEGGYVIVAPSDGYKPIYSDLFNICELSIEERDFLLAKAKGFNQAQVQSQPAAVSSTYDYTDPVSWFNWNKAGFAKNLLKEKGWTIVGTTAKDADENWRRPDKKDGISATWGHKYNSLYVFTSSVSYFKNECYYTPFQIVCILRFNRNFSAATQWILSKYFEESNPFIRVGTDYFKKVKKLDRYSMLRTELKAWTKDEIKQDHGKAYIDNIPRFDDFTILPNNLNYQPVVENCYNLYKEFTHTPAQGSWYWSNVLMNHIFMEQYNLGIRYLQAMYLHPERSLPILVLVSKERQTGKTTFLNWLNMIFGDNMVNISPEDLTGSFNHIYATSNIIAVEETLIEKAITVEKLKAIATAKFMTVNQKFVSQYKIPFYGKIILASNNEDKFARIDEEEIRFFVRKVGRPTVHNHNIEADLSKEIPAFLHHLTTLPPIDWSRDRSGFTPDEITNESLLNVKSESKSGLFKEISDYISDLFNNHPNGVDSFLAAPVDIKAKWFQNNHNVSSPYIRSVLKNDFKLTPSDKLIRYTPFGIPYQIPETRVGTPYSFVKSMFVKNLQHDNLQF